jgi:hypothetical protein
MPRTFPYTWQYITGYTPISQYSIQTQPYVSPGGYVPGRPLYRAASEAGDLGVRYQAEVIGDWMVSRSQRSNIGGFSTMLSPKGYRLMGWSW